MDTFTAVNNAGLEGLRLIVNAQSMGGGLGASAVSVVFAADTRPGAEALRALAAETGQFALSFDPRTQPGDESGWVELLANGLTFDCSGIAPGLPEALPERRHSFGLPPDLDLAQAQAITIVPGPHIAGGGAMFPVVRCLAWLGALLADLPGVQAVAWHGARSYNAPAHFRKGVLHWIEGGVFPGLGLTALVPTPEGGMASEGLAMFTGQELELVPDLAADRAEGAKLALRLIHWLVENGRVDMASQMVGPSGETLLLEPVNNQQIIKVSKS